VLNCRPPASGGRRPSVGNLEQDAGVAALVERAPADRIMAAQDPAGFGVAGGPATEPATAVAVSGQRTTRTPSS
jgi:hypothetical protein